MNLLLSLMGSKGVLQKTSGLNCKPLGHFPSKSIKAGFNPKGSNGLFSIERVKSRVIELVGFKEELEGFEGGMLHLHLS